MEHIKLAYIIDDDNITIYLTGRLLKKADFADETRTFTNGLQAIQALKRAVTEGSALPDVILFDLSMPVMDGWEFVEAFKELKLDKDIPLFIFSSSIDPLDQARSFQYAGHIHGFITKPLTLQKLTKICRLVTT